MSECNPEHYISRSEHDDHCKSVRLWTEVARKASEDDRKMLWGEVGLLRAFKEKVQWAILGALCMTMLSIWIAPYLTRNGEATMIKELNGKINLIMEKQDIFDNTLNAVRYDQQRREAREK